ncbi:MAG: thioredoxin family protein [Bacteroidetes bacterium]|nr:thioredoxin family protein [Bacteroidota bacterium]
MRQLVFSLFALLILSGVSRPVHAQFGAPDVKLPEEYVTWKTTPIPSSIGPGGKMVARVQATIEGDWKMYALDASLPVQQDVLSRPYGVVLEWTGLPEGFKPLASISQEAPESGFDTNFNLELKYFHKKATFYFGVAASDSVATGTYSLDAKVRYQICSDSLGLCLRPTTVPIQVELAFDASCIGCTATPEALELLESGSGPSEAGVMSSDSDYDNYRRNGFWPFIFLAIGAGLASLLTPCVFPMIPLTVSYFTNQGKDRAKAVRMSLVYGASIVITFTGIGVIMALVVGAAGAQSIASSPWVNLLIATVLIGFALSLLGVFELRLPSFVLNWAGSKGQSDTSWTGVLFMGLTLTLVSFSCTAPFVGGLLAAASGGTWAFPLFGMLAYSTTFALPFVLLSLFPRALQKLPSSGSWMNSVKVILGFIEIAAAVKFLSNADLVWGFGLISRTLGIAFVLVVFFLAGLYLLGKLRFPHDPPVETVGVGRLFAAIFFFVLALYMIPGLLGAPLKALDAYLPPARGSDVSIYSTIGASEKNAGSSEEDWFIDDIEGAFAEAEAQQRPLFVDFSGWTCTNCRQMEANVFPLPGIASRFSNDFVLLRLYTDDLKKGDAFHQFQMELTGTPALPTFAIVSPADRQLLTRRSAMMDEGEFAAFLDEGVASFRRLTP